MYAKKSLGQNFLTSDAIVDRIIDAASIQSRDIVLEVGPGKGILTQKLLGIAREVIAVEKDERLIFYLQLKFKKEIEDKKLKLITGDILSFEPEKYDLQRGGYKIVANIPYYITGNFLRRFMSEVGSPSHMILMVQKEVAERIIAKDGKESILSISVKTHGTPHYVETVPKDFFSPVPKVDSAIIAIENISKNFFADVPEQKFFSLIKKGFSSKRKMLSNNLPIPPLVVRNILSSCGISETARAEDLTISNWKCLLKKHKE